MSNKLYRLTPSDFGYLYTECKHCYYQKVKHGLSVSGAFPSMFTRINSLLQNSIMGMDLADIHPSFPSGLIESQEGGIKSVPINVNYYLTGRYDILVRMDDGTYTLIDFKITSPEEESIQKKYSTQLHAYKYGLENPANGKDPITISRMGVISVNPEEMKVIDGKIVFTTLPTWHEVKIDMDSFYSLVNEIAALLDGDLPEPSEKCKLCKYRNYFLTPSMEVTEDIPF